MQKSGEKMKTRGIRLLHKRCAISAEKGLLNWSLFVKFIYSEKATKYMNFKPHDSLAYFVLAHLKTNQTVQFFGENARNLSNLKCSRRKGIYRK